MSDKPQETETVILVDLAPVAGVRSVAAVSPAELARLSAEALDNAMDAIQAMNGKVAAMVRGIKMHERPSQVELEFGLKLNADAGVLVARAGAEAAINVTLTWEATPEKALRPSPRRMRAAR